MTTDTETKRPGSRLTSAGLWIAGVAALLIAVVTIGGGTMSLGLVAITVVGLVIAAIGFAIRVVAALEAR